MPNFFIKRPNFALVIAIFIALAGLLAISSLPVAQYPSVAPPQVIIKATYPGASAEVINNTVISLIEEELNGAKGLLYYESQSNSAGVAETTVTFEPGTNPDLAQVDVQNRIKRVESRLPQAWSSRVATGTGQLQLPADLRADVQGRGQGPGRPGRLRGPQHQQ